MKYDSAMLFRAAWWALLLVPLCPAGPGPVDRDTLTSLWHSKHWFALRDTLPQVAPQPVFYQAAVACAFNDAKSCEQKVRRFLKTGDPDGHPAAHNFLVALYMREGRFREALKHREEILRIQEKLDKPDGLRTLLARFSQYPELSAASRRASRVRGEFRDGHLFVPVVVDGEPGKYILDTGANLSTLTESEAKRLGLHVSDLNVDRALVGEASGKGVEGPRFAVAERLELGGVHLKNVPFLVVKDGPDAFSALPPGYRGAIGIQVLLACRTIRWDSGATVHLNGAAPRKNIRSANLCFNGLDTFVEMALGKDTLDIHVDTGADGSSLYQRFAKRYPDLLRASGTPAMKWVGGAGGSVEVAATLLPEIALQVGGFAAALRPVYVLAKEHDADGTIGMDLFSQAREVTFDFRAMRVTLSK
jgi:hypothetical protein